MTIQKLSLENTENHGIFTRRRIIECGAFCVIAVAILVLQLQFWNQAVMLSSMDTAKSLANSFDKNILLFVSADDIDADSNGLKETFFGKASVLSKLSKNYVVVNIDFSQKRFEAIEPAQDSSKRVQKQKERLREQLRKEFTLCTKYSLQQYPTIPAIYLLTKKCYMIAAYGNDADYSGFTKEDVFRLIEFQDERAAKFNGLYADIEAATGLEKAKAILAFNDATEQNYQPLLIDLWAEFIKLDAKNETGSLGKFIYLKAFGDASDFFMDQNYESAYKALMNAAESEYLSPDEKQQLIFNGTSIAYQSGALSSDAVLIELRKAYEYNPESQTGEYIKGIITQFEQEAEQ